MTPQVEGPLASLHGGGRGRPKDTIDRPHCCWSVKLLAATPALKIKGWRSKQAGRQAGRQANSRQAGGRASPSVTQEAYAEFTRPAKNCCMYIQQLRERPSLLKEVDGPCDDACVTGRTRILLPPASWRRAQLRGHLRITANQHRHLRRTRARAIESVLSKDVQGTGRGRGFGDLRPSQSLAVPFCQYFEKSQAKILKIAFCSKGLLL